MKKIILVLLITLTTLMANFVMKNDGTLTPTTDTQVTATTEPAATTKQAPYTVIPGLYSFGTDTRAAYGGTVDPIVLHVNTLVAGVSNTDSTHGSFKWCLTQAYPRIVVFDVSGVIDASNTIEVHTPYLTIAGQTAPDNVVLHGYGIRIYSHDIVIQHLAVRNKTDALAAGKDCITAVATSTDDAYNIIVDHCSGSWADDESMSIGYNTRIIHDVTFSNCIIGESVNKNYGSLNYGEKLAHIGNLYIHNYMRNPQLGYDCELGVYNSLTYNYAHSNVQIAGALVEGIDKLTYIGNVTIAGLDSGTQDYQTALVKLLNGTSQPKENSIIYMEDNINRGTHIAGDDVWIGDTPGYTVGSKLLPPNFVPKPASETRDYVLGNVGSRPAHRDAVDTRLINDVINGTGSIISTAPALPAYSTLTQAFVPVTNPHDMYDEHYTNLEHQLHQLSTAVEK